MGGSGLGAEGVGSMQAALAESRDGHGSSGTSRLRRGQPHCDHLSSSTHERPRQEARAPL